LDFGSFGYPSLRFWPIAVGLLGNISDTISLLIHFKNMHQHAQRSSDYAQKSMGQN